VKIFLLKPSVEIPAVNLKIDRIKAILNKSGNIVVEQGLSKYFFSQIIAEKPDVVFNLASIFEWEKTIHIPAILEIAAVRYTGSGFLALSLSRNPTKLLPLFEKSGVRLSPYKVLPAAQAVSTHSLRFPLDLCRDGNPDKIYLADEQALINALEKLPQEEQLTLREHLQEKIQSVFILDSTVLPNSTAPALLPPALTTYRLLEARGLMRLDFTISIEPVLVNINAAPDPLEEVFLKAASSAGWDEQKIIQTIIEHAGRD
jgi:D-alanine-D-alanine ligase-like ATP-grasp enzyme